MLFNSYEFVFLFLPLTLLVYWVVLRNASARRIGLLVAGLLFYAYASLGYLVLLLAMTLFTFLSARYLMTSERPTRQKLGLLAGVIGNLGVLLLFKYLSSMDDPSRFDWPVLGRQARIILPLGISFYTFNLIGYCLDVYRRRIPAAASPFAFVSYSTFFPTVMSGPLVRYADFRTQRESALSQPYLLEGFFSLSIGLAKKLLIADQIAAQINPLFAQYDQLGFFGAWLVALGYTYQLYFDFSGYTDMAIGVGYLLGFRLPLNFNAPYTSRNITDFWQRWHITLSNWFRDYLFFPISRALLKRGKFLTPDWIRTISLVITMTLIGLWHGMSWTFVVWGAYHGLLLAIHAQTRALHWKAWPLPLARAATFLAIVAGWVLFRSNSFDMAATLYRSMLGLNGFDTSLLDAARIGLRFTTIIAGLAVITNLPYDTATLRPRLNWAYAAAFAVLLTMCVLMIDKGPQEFLYFQF
jgi:alginate O-acetyltransferase complex protein AlgI